MTRRLLAAACAVLLLGWGFWRAGRELLVWPPPWPAETLAPAAVPPLPASREGVPAFRHVWLILLENRSPAVVGRVPYLRALRRRYAWGVLQAAAHPSLPNYLALVAGTTFGVHSDCAACLVRGENLASQLLRRRRTVGVYLEGIPFPGYTGAVWWPGLYAGKHNPFRYFRGVPSPPTWPLGRLQQDLREDAVPDLSWITPDLCHDMHSCPAWVGDRWLQVVVPRIVESRAWRRGGLLVILWDEGTRGPGGGWVPVLLVSPWVRPGAVLHGRYTDASVLRTLEDVWRLPYLGAARRARPLAGIWRGVGEFLGSGAANRPGGRHGGGGSGG